jgi:uncharacterized phiE125 gp8 family phage protein
MRADWTLVAAPAEEPLTVDQVKAQCRIYAVGDEDALLTEYIAASRQDAEEYTSRGLFTQTWKLTQDDWSDEIWLPRAAPLQSVSSVQYYDASGVLQTLATSYYRTDTVSEPGRVVRAPLQVWPALEAGRAGAVIVNYIVGWTDVDNIPSLINHGIALLVQGRYRRETGPAWRDTWDAATSCWSKYRVSWRPPVCAS